MKQTLSSLCMQPTQENRIHPWMPWGPILFSQHFMRRMPETCTAYSKINFGQCFGWNEGRQAVPPV